MSQIKKAVRQSIGYVTCEVYKDIELKNIETTGWFTNHTKDEYLLIEREDGTLKYYDHKFIKLI